jgi:hypothetical protein
MSVIYGEKSSLDEENIDVTDPFWAAMKRNEVPDPETMTEEDLEILKGMEEARQARIDAMNALDQA